ncbi:MAG: hypothetical protein AABY18_05850 [Candidatus Thermoplasmatota archaeon]
MTRRDEDGVSNVVGAILMFGLLVLTLTVIQVRFVPVWAEDREARHMGQLRDQLGQLDSDITRMAANDTANSLADPLTLKKESGFQFFAGTNLGGQANFVPATTGTGVSLTSTHEVNVVRRNGQNLYSLDDDNWQPDFGGSDIQSALSISHLRERIDLVTGTVQGGGDSLIDPNSGGYADGDSVIVEIFDATDDLTPVATVTTTFHAPGAGGSEVWFTLALVDKNGNEIATDFESMFQQIYLDYLYLDLFDGALFLEPLLAAAQAPFRVALTEQGLIGDYQVAYVDADSGGVSGGAGLRESSFAQVTQSGRLQVVAQNQHFVDQTYVLEHGAVILEQATGSVMVIPPAISVQSSGAIASLTWTIPGLDGDAVTQSGGRALNALVAPTGAVVEVWLGAYELRLDIPTGHGQAWCDYLDTALSNAGLSASGVLPDYALTATSAACQLSLYGPTGDPNDTVDRDVFLRLRSSIIDLSLVPG